VRRWPAISLAKVAYDGAQPLKGSDVAMRAGDTRKPVADVNESWLARFGNDGHVTPNV
jgi:hypothetical protein